MISGSTASFRPSGIGRYFDAAFLSLWLAVWIVGEAVAIGLLAVILGSMSSVFSKWLPAGATDLATSGAAGFVILFLLVGLTLWTFGGIAAVTNLLRSLAGEDAIALEGSGLELVRRAGPFRRRYAIERSAIRRVRIRPHDNALVADTGTGTRILTQFGSAQELQAAAEWLTRALALPDQGSTDTNATPPATWEVTSREGSTYLRKIQPRMRTTRSLIAWLVTGVVALAWFASLGGGISTESLPALLLTLVLACGASMSMWGRREWIVRPGQLTFRQSFTTWSNERTFSSARLEVTHHTDSDNDSHYKLIVTDAHGRKTIHSELNDWGEVVDLGRWLASRVGFPLTLARALRPRRTAGLTGEGPT